MTTDPFADLKLNLCWTGQSWPLDPPGYVLLLRALQAEIGPAIEADWIGQEFGLLGPPAHPSRVVTAAPRPTPSIGSWRPARPEPPPRTSEELAALVRDIEKRFQDRLARAQSILERAASVRERVARAALYQELETAYRYDRTGGMYPIEAAWWNTEHVYPRFSEGKIDRLNPTTRPRSPNAPQEHCWLYVTRSSLDTFLVTLGAERKAREQQDPSAPWWPSANVSLGDWCILPESEGEARSRAKAENGSESEICRQLASMWASAGRPTRKTTWKYIERRRAEQRQPG